MTQTRLVVARHGNTFGPKDVVTRVGGRTDLPLVASGRPSLDELLGDAALFVDPADEDAIAEALARVLTDDSLRSDLRERGRERAGRYSWARTAALTREAIVRAAAS